MTEYKNKQSKKMIKVRWWGPEAANLEARVFQDVNWFDTRETDWILFENVICNLNQFFAKTPTTAFFLSSVHYGEMLKSLK